MYKILFFLAGVGLIWWGVTMDSTTKIFIMNNAIWLIITLSLIAALVAVCARAMSLQQHNITVYDNRQWNTDNSTHSTTNTAYINQAEPNRIGANNSYSLTDGG